MLITIEPGEPLILLDNQIKNPARGIGRDADRDCCVFLAVATQNHVQNIKPLSVLLVNRGLMKGRIPVWRCAVFFLEEPTCLKL